MGGLPGPSSGSDQSANLISAQHSDKAAQDVIADASAPEGKDNVRGINSPRIDEVYKGSQDVIAQVGAVRGGVDLERENSEEIFSPKPHPLDHQGAYKGPSRGKWFRRVRSVFCCFAPRSKPVPSGADRDLQGIEFDKESKGASHRSIPSEAYTSFVIGPKSEEDKSKKTLVLDLDETLVHSSFRPVDDPDFILPVDIDGKLVDVYVMKRPWLEHFMQIVGSKFEVVVFTASLSKYADPLLDLLDEASVVRWRLFREACSEYEGNFVKDLNRLGRNLAQTIIVDNSPLSYIFHPSNALPIGAFMGEKDDQELLEMVPLLLDLEGVDDVREYLAEKADGFTGHVLSNGVSLVPLGSGVGSEVVCESG